MPDFKLFTPLSLRSVVFNMATISLWKRLTVRYMKRTSDRWQDSNFKNLNYVVLLWNIVLFRYITKIELKPCQTTKKPHKLPFVIQSRVGGVLKKMYAILILFKCTRQPVSVAQSKSINRNPTSASKKKENSFEKPGLRIAVFGWAKLVRVIGRFEKSRRVPIREIGILLNLRLFLLDRIIMYWRLDISR